MPVYDDRSACSHCEVVVKKDRLWNVLMPVELACIYTRDLALDDIDGENELREAGQG